MSKNKKKEQRKAMSTATLDHPVEETTPVTDVQDEVLVGTPQPITSEEDRVFEELIRQETEENAAFEANLVADTGLVNTNIHEAHEDEQLADPIESYEEPIHEPQIAPEPIADSVSAVGEVMDLPAEQPPPAEVPKPEPTKAELIEMLGRFQEELAKLRNGESSSKRQIASGSKARPNVLYTILAKPNSWHSTPQVAQIQGLLFEPDVAAKHGKDGVVQLTEPELFAIIEAGKAEGKLKTKQPAVRIFQYYRNELLNSNTLRWK